MDASRFLRIDGHHLHDEDADRDKPGASMRGVLRPILFAGLLLTPAASMAQGDKVEAARKALELVHKENERRVLAAEANVKLAEAEANLTAARLEVAKYSQPQLSPASTSGDGVKISEASAEAIAGKVLERQKKAAADDGNEFGGVKLGAGFSLTRDLGKLDRISDAQIVDGIVRVNDQNNTPARLMLESHYFFTPKGDFGVEENSWGIGPFVAIQPGSGQIIDAIGMGVMLGFRRDPETSDSFNVGLGIVVDPNTRVLGDGFVENQPAPINEKEVRYRETTQVGAMLLTSFSF